MSVIVAAVFSLVGLVTSSPSSSSPSSSSSSSLSSEVRAPGLRDDAIVAFVMVDRFADGAPNLPDVVAGHPRRFQGGDLAGLRARLPYLHSLGVTHIWLTPIATQVPGLVGSGADATAAYHGYWPRDLQGVDPHFGDEQALRAFVDAARGMGIGVVLDVVANHLGYGAPATDRLVRPTCGDTELDRCLFGLPDLQTEDPRVQAVVVDRTVAWARDVDLAGFRFDAFRHVGADVFRAIRSEARTHRPGFFTFAEIWGAAPGDDAVDDAVASGAADAVLDFSFGGLARDWVSGRMRSAAFAHHVLARDTALARGPPMLSFLDNHDVETWAHAVGPSRAPLGAPLLFFDRAVPVVTWGTEVGRAGGAGDPENRTSMSWDDVALAEADPRSPLHLWRALAALRRRHPVLHHGALSVVARDAVSSRDDDDDNAGVRAGFVVLQRAGAGSRAVVAVARGQPLQHVQSLAAGARLVDVVASPGGTAALAHGRLVVRVPADGSVTVVVDERAVDEPAR
jgi:alpha-amylase